MLGESGQLPLVDGTQKGNRIYAYLVNTPSLKMKPGL